MQYRSRETVNFVRRQPRHGVIGGKLSVGIAYLDRHANEDKYLILILLCSSLPPKLETPEPIARSAEAWAMARRQWVVRLVSTKQLDLPAAHDEEVLVRSLE